MSIDLRHGDCLEVLRSLTDNSVDAIVTDPPYGLSFMGKRWDYDVPSVEVWAECLRVLKPGGHILAFAGTRTQHRMAVRIEDAGFEIRDMIAWVYGSGFPKSHNLKDDWQGWGTALKPALEPITVARKPLVGTVAQNVETHGTGAMNITASRIPLTSEADAAEFANNHAVTERLPDSYAGKSLDLHDGGWKQKVGPAEVPEGRWPANLLHDGSDEVVSTFPQTATGSAARFFYCTKASTKDRGPGNDHPTVKPTALMRYLVKLVTPPGGRVLDPFMGSGSTGKAAILEGFRFIGIEREAEYLEIARARIAVIQPRLL